MIDFVNTFSKLLSCDMSRKLNAHDKKMQDEAGTTYLILHGCTRCHKFVYLPSDPRKSCPLQTNGEVCGHPRFSTDRTPNEVCIYYAVLFAFCFSYVFIMQFFLLFVFLIM